jgi:protein-tyrosine phosphatase
MVYRINCVCLGNICRSPMAETVLRNCLWKASLADAVSVASSGTSRYHLGEDMDTRARATLTQAGYTPADHSGSQASVEALSDSDLVLAMDSANHAEITALANRAELRVDHVRLFRSFDPTAPAEANVPDPYYGQDDGFAEVLGILERAAHGVTAFVTAELADR